MKPASAKAKGRWAENRVVEYLRMMAPYLPLSVEMANAVAVDERPISYNIDTGELVADDDVIDVTADGEPVDGRDLAGEA